MALDLCKEIIASDLSDAIISFMTDYLKNNGVIMKRYYKIAGVCLEIVSEHEFYEMRALSAFACVPGERDEVTAHYKVQTYRETPEFCNETLIYENERIKEYDTGDERIRVCTVHFQNENLFFILRQRKKQPQNMTLFVPKKRDFDFGVHFLFWDHLAFEKILLENCAFLLHASLVKLEDAGIVFTAPSGTGKSTQASLWEKYYNAEILNGDRAIVRKEEKFYAYGSPMAGTSCIYKNEGVCLRAVIILTQADSNYLIRASSKTAFIRLYKESFVDVWDRRYVEQITELISQLIYEVPVYQLACRPDREAVDLVYQEIFLRDGEISETKIGH